MLHDPLTQSRHLPQGTDKLGALGLVILLAACSNIPTDPNGTAEQILRLRSFDVGIVSGSNPEETAVIVERIEKITGASARLRREETSLLTDQLEKGKIDLIIGSFAKNSPLKKTVTFSAAIGNRKVPSDQPVTRAGMAPGENRWIMLVEKAVRHHD